MRILVPGGTGFLGHPLCSRLADDGHDVVTLTRRGSPAAAAWTDRPGVRKVHWAGDGSTHGWAHLVEGADVVVNLAGESIAGRRWTPRQKERIERSRVETTRSIAEVVASAATPPRLLVSGSAVGYYGDRQDEVLTEDSRPGTCYLAGVAVRWEAAAMAAVSPRTRVVWLRTGLALAREGGALQQMLLPFRLGLGGPFGSGRQYMPWIHRDDWVALVRFILTADIGGGAVNATAPDPVSNAVFARTLGRVLRRPAVLPAPAFALRLALGEMADPLLLSGQRAVPRRALEAGFTFRYADLEQALESAVNDNAEP